jgi:hypothetical protein
MKAPAIPLVHVHTETEPHQELAAAVVRQAIADLAHPTGMVRNEARHFLTGSDDFYWWCGVAGLEPDRVLGKMRRAGSLR